jgi:hypothetical protein
MAKILSGIEFISILLLLAVVWLAVMHWVWPRLLAATIFIYSGGVLVLFLGLVFFAIFSGPRR